MSLHSGQSFVEGPGRRGPAGAERQLDAFKDLRLQLKVLSVIQCKNESKLPYKKCTTRLRNPSFPPAKFIGSKNLHFIRNLKKSEKCLS
jgi:hypothetical protein